MSRKAPLLLTLMLFTSALYAQDAQVSGFVKDQSSAVIPKSRVAIRNVNTGAERFSITNDSGLYTIPALPPGTYTITVQASGFQTVVRDGVKLDVAQNARLDFVLQVGQAAQTITVEGAAVMMNTESATVGTVVDRQFVGNMPLNGRSFQSLI